MKKAYRLKVNITAFLLLAIVIFPSNGKVQQSPGKVYQEFIESEPVADIARQGEINVHEIIVEKARKVSISCSWHHGDLTFDLTDPHGNRFDSTAGLSNYNVEYKVYKFPEGIIEAVFDLTGNFPAGIWTLRVTTEDKTELGIGYTIEVYHRDPELNVQCMTNKSVYKLDEKVIISTVLQCETKPVIGATVLAIIARERDIIDTLILLDDGFHDDSLANDGRYAFIFQIPSRQGDYYIQFNISKSGENSFAREDDSPIMFIVNNSSIIGPSFEKTVDNDNNGLYDSLIVGINFDLTNANDYQIYASLYDNYDKKIAVSRICDNFSKGRQSIEFSFDGSTIFEHGTDGPYFLKGLILSDSCDNVPPLDSLQDVYTTKQYNFRDFEHGPIYITEKHEISELDIDNDGLIDSLILNLEVELEEEGHYKWSGFFRNEEDRFTCCQADNEGFVESGVSDIRLSFSGYYIGKCPFDGVYTIRVIVSNKKHGRFPINSVSFKGREYKHTDFE